MGQWCTGSTPKSDADRRTILGTEAAEGVLDSGATADLKSNPGLCFLLHSDQCLKNILKKDEKAGLDRT